MTFPMGEIDPNTVRPGWVALLIVLALAGATVLLWRNMGKQLKRIDFDPPGQAEVPPEPADPTGRVEEGDVAPVQTPVQTPGQPSAQAPADAADRPGDRSAHDPGRTRH